MKINPSSGAVIWNVVVPGNGSSLTPAVVGLEALRGTNHVLAAMSDGSLCRVDDTGVQLWFVNNRGARGFGTDASSIIVTTDTSLNIPVGMTYAGGSSWSAPGVTNVNRILVGDSMALALSPGPTTKSISTGAGSVNWTNTIYSGIATIEPGGNFTTYDGTFTTKRYDGTSQALITTVPGDVFWNIFSGGFAKFTPSSTFMSGFTGGCKGAITTALVPGFTLNSIGGASMAGKDILSGTADSSSYFYGGDKLTGTASVMFNIFKVNSGGSLSWIQLYGNTSNPPISTAAAQSMCRADNGFIYVGGIYCVYQ